MNRDLLEALGAIAADIYIDAMRRHPGLFVITGVTTITDDDRAIMPVPCAASMSSPRQRASPEDVDRSRVSGPPRLPARA